MKRITLGLIAIIIFNSCASYLSTKNNANLIFFVEQRIVEPVYRFEIDEQTLKVYELKLVIKKRGDSKEKKIKKYSKKLEKVQIREINALLESMLSLKSEYSESFLGGITWNVGINYQGKNKHIYIDNTIVPRVFTLFEYINNVIPDGKPKISTQMF